MSVGVLSHTGFIVPSLQFKSKLGAAYGDVLKKLTVVKQQKVGPPKRAQMYKFEIINGIHYIHLPRTMIQSLVKNKILDGVNVNFGPIRTIGANLSINLFDNQKVIIKYLIDNVFTGDRINDGSATCILNLRAGMGKTFVAAGVIDALKMRTLYVVSKRPLAVQAVKDLRACFDGGDSKTSIIIGMYGKVKKNEPSVDKHDITVIVINSALTAPAEFFAGYSLIILDEVHSYCSEQRKEIFQKSARCVLGMSATTENRSDGFDVISHKELAFDGVIRAENIPGFGYENIEFKTTVDVIYYNGMPEYTKALTHDSTGKVFTPYMNAQFVADPVRMRLVVQKLRELYDWRGPNGEHHCIYVFCEERGPLKTIFEMLKNSFEVNAPELEELTTNTGEFIGGIKDSRVSELKNNARILLTTYGYSGTGISIDKMTAIIFVTPRKANMLQILARILRRGGNRDITRRVIDIVDNKTPMRYQYGERALAYDYYGMDVVISKVKYDEVK